MADPSDDTGHESTEDIHDSRAGTEHGPEGARESRESASDRPGIDESGWEGSREDRERARARRRVDRLEEQRRRASKRQGRKERVLHTRVSEQLSDDIRRLAEDLRVPTSNLVRNVLEEVFTVVESVSEDVGDLLEDVLEEAVGARERIRRRADGRQRRSHHRHHGSRESWSDVAEAEIARDEAAETGAGRETRSSASRDHRPTFPDVIGWQPLVMNHSQDCADCGRRIRSGARAFVGLTDKGISRTTLCRSCLQDRG